MTSVAIVIPARFASTRLPGKPLVEIAGKPMIRHVVERAWRVRGVERVVVAADDERVHAAVAAFGGEVIMTSPHHASGTDRLVEVMQSVNAELYINLQGDEPLLRSADVELLIAGMQHSADAMAGSLYHTIDSVEAENPNLVKVVLDAAGYALYFSRAKIPFDRDGGGEARYNKHVGIYAYRRELLARYSQLEQPMAERAEKLEQLRVLHAGLRMRLWEIPPVGPGVDTPECLEKVRAIFAGKHGLAEEKVGE